MSRIGDQAAAIAAVIDAVPDSGVVYAYRPMPSGEWNKFVASFTVVIAGVRHVRAWTVQYMGEERHEQNIAMTAAKQLHYLRWKVRFYYGWADPGSEPAFRSIVESVADALDSSRTLGGACISHDPVDIVVPANGDGVMLGDYLCHTAELDFRAWDEVNFTIT
jgi:hypothetical protein